MLNNKAIRLLFEKEGCVCVWGGGGVLDLLLMPRITEWEVVDNVRWGCLMLDSQDHEWHFVVPAPCVILDPI